MTTRTCIICNEVFTVTAYRGRSITCSAACSHRYNNIRAGKRMREIRHAYAGARKYIKEEEGLVKSAETGDPLELLVDARVAAASIMARM